MDYHITFARSEMKLDSLHFAHSLGYSDRLPVCENRHLPTTIPTTFV